MNPIADGIGSSTRAGGILAATKPEKIVGGLMLGGALAYLVRFVSRGWIPWDEGLIGESAEWVLRGGIPHLTYQDPYTGGLAWIYAAMFTLAGVDLLFVRWLLFAGAALSLWLMYAILRRYLRPIGAALATWVGLAWSFPNYFAGLPSWWLLVCALACLWTAIRHLETGRWSYLAAAGLSTGIAIAIKQTGVYLLIALLLFLVYDSAPTARTSRVDRLAGVLRWGVAVTTLTLASLLLARRLLGGEGVYLFAPIAACSLLVLRPWQKRPWSMSGAHQLRGVGIAVVAAAVPLMCLLVPYLVQHRLSDFVQGALVLPNKRLTFASVSMMPAGFIVTGIPMLALVVPVPESIIGARSRVFESLIWAAAVALPIVALWNLMAYQFIWQSTHAFAALLPVAICWRLASPTDLGSRERRVLFLSGAMLAWVSLNQFPFAAPAYFCYVAPLAVIAGVAIASTGSCLRPRAILPWTLMVLVFAVLSLNRSYFFDIGLSHAPYRFDTALDLPRAHLTVSAADADMYRRVVSAIDAHRGGGRLMAGPDAPEVYFLSGRVNPLGTLFDFFIDSSTTTLSDELARWLNNDVIVVKHGPTFSPAPSVALMENLRRAFPNSETVGRFEVRWRELAATRNQSKGIPAR